MSRSIASSASLLSVPTRWPNTSSTRLQQARPLFSSATMVLSKVGGAGLRGDRLDLGDVLGERPLVGRQEMLGPDAAERRHAERACSRLCKERIFVGDGRMAGYRWRHARILPSSRFQNVNSSEHRGGNMVSFTLNDKRVSVDADPNTPLLWVIREHVGLTGTKYGCGAGLCGACTVHRRRQGGARLPDAGFRGGEQDGRHHRGPVAEFLAPAAEGLGRAGSAAMRLLPVRPDHEGGRTARQQSRSRTARRSSSTWTATSAAAAPITSIIAAVEQASREG